MNNSTRKRLLKEKRLKIEPPQPHLVRSIRRHILVAESRYLPPGAATNCRPRTSKSWRKRRGMVRR